MPVQIKMEQDVFAKGGAREKRKTPIWGATSGVKNFYRGQKRETMVGAAVAATQGAETIRKA